MSKIGDFFGWVFLTALLFWVLAMFFAPTPCQRVQRAAWPVEYSFALVQYLAKNWTDLPTQVALVEWKVSSVLATRSFFEKTVYGEGKACTPN